MHRVVRFPRLARNSGAILKSISYNANRFRIDPQLCRILMNTIPVLEEVAPPAGGSINSLCPHFDPEFWPHPVA